MSNQLETVRVPEKTDSIRLIEAYVQRQVDRLPNQSIEDTRRIILDNILSIRRAIQSANHSLGFDPTVGMDVIRQFLAYDLVSFIVIDVNSQILDRNIEELMELLNQVGIKFLFNEKNTLVKECTFTLDGIPRKITFINKDARDVSLSDYVGDKVDVFHVSLPTGAEEETERQKEARSRGDYGYIEGDDSMIHHPGYKPALNWFNYSKISKNGILVLNERSLLPYGSLPWSFTQAIGIKEIPISARHPYTILTSFYPSTLEAEYHGHILHKKKQLAKEDFDQMMEMVDLIGTELFLFFSLINMQLYYFQDKETGQYEHPFVIIMQRKQSIIDGFNKNQFFQKHANKDEILSDLIKFFHELVRDYIGKLSKFFSIYDQLHDQPEQLKKELGIEKNEFGRDESREFPFATYLILNEYRPYLYVFRELIGYEDELYTDLQSGLTQS